MLVEIIKFKNNKPTPGIGLDLDHPAGWQGEAVMPHKFRRKKLAYLIHTALVTSLAAPGIAQAQDDTVEEITVTGSYIRNSAFAARYSC